MNNKKVKMMAGICLFIALFLYIISLFFIKEYPFFGYVKAFAEAAMIGGMADWFAVTALFRHPFGLPIPHTAIIPKNKDKIANKISEFFRGNFLSEQYLKENIERLELSKKAGFFIERNNIQITDKIIALIFSSVKQLQYKDLQLFLKEVIADNINSFDAKYYSLEVLKNIYKEGKHHELIDIFLKYLSEWLSVKENKRIINEEIRNVIRKNKKGENSFFGSIKASFIGELDLDVYLNNFITNLNNSDETGMRKDIDKFFSFFIQSLEKSPAFENGINNIKLTLTKDDTLQKIISKFIEELNNSIEKDLISTDSKIKNTVSDYLSRISNNLINDEKWNNYIKEKTLHYIPKLIKDNANLIDKYLINYIKNLDSKEVSDLIEDKVGEDLQYIRINGTLVGGCIGLIIYTTTNIITLYF